MITVLIGTRTLSVTPRVMRLRRAVPKILTISSDPRRLPLYKSPLFLTHSESTLLQVLIPLHFNSPRINVYKKTGRGSLLAAQKFCNSSLPTRHSVCLLPYILTSLRLYITSSRLCPHTATPANPITSVAYLTVLCIPGWGNVDFRPIAVFRFLYFEFRVSSPPPLAASASPLWTVRCQLPAP
jgi:hypothetical protein